MGTQLYSLTVFNIHTKLPDTHAVNLFCSTAHARIMFSLTTSSTLLAKSPAMAKRKTTVSRFAHHRFAINNNSSAIQHIAPVAPKHAEVREVAQIAAKAAPPPPPAKFITNAQYITACSAVFGIYALQMLLVPAKMITDHFNASADQMTQFWIRGSACAFALAIWAMRQLPVATGVQMGFYLALSCGILYPWNAKFNLFKNNLPVKYPMHYVPEVLIALLSAAGAYLIYM